MEKLSYFALYILEPAIMLVGVCVSLIRFRSLGKAAFVFAAGFLLLILASILDIAYSSWALFWFDYSTESNWYGRVFWIKTVARTLCTVMGFVLLIVAIVMKRTMSDTVQ